ncbi:putative ribose/galactose/methyl galactoside import ATP-binding protein 2 [Arthrobacter sp. Hiyo6]|nr:putative ribose/galactose/methyl galactoside import ATP-binding protein 2 [Arthrobacter sp. Hiyo6]
MSILSTGPDSLNRGPLTEDIKALKGIGLTKQYGGNTVLHGVDITLKAGTVLGFIGENGAGKSTLSSILAGIKTPDAGEMWLDGAPYAPNGPASALNSGVAIIHQEIKMVPRLSVAENMFLGRWPKRRGRVDTASMAEQAEAALAVLGAKIDPRRAVAGLSMAAQQEIEIAKAILRDPSYVIFDEPSASLGQEETEKVLDQIRILRDRGAGVIYISHRLDEISAIADEILCLRDGRRAKAWETGSVGKDDMIRAMVGREFVYAHQAPQPAEEDVVLEVNNLTRHGVFRDVSFSVRRGEILGMSGLVGAGRTEVVRTCRRRPGRCWDGHCRGKSRRNPQRLKRHPGRHLHGARGPQRPRPEPGRSGGENMVLPWEKTLTASGFVTNRTVKRVEREQAVELDIRGNLNIPVLFLSGGNQQKVLLAKWLVRKPKVLILDEPTRGVDVGAKAAIYEIVRKLAAAGVAIIVVSSELEEVLGLSHRVLVMAGGRQRGILTRDEALPDRVMELSVP